MDVGDLVAERFRLDALLGRCRHADVFEARDQATGRDVVVTAYVDEGCRARLRRDGAALSRVTHPAVVRYVAHGDDHLVTEPGDGTPLIERLDHRLAAGEILDVAHALAGGLAALHDRGVVHGGVAAHNVLLGDGAITLTGYGCGCARLHGGEPPRRVAPERRANDDAGRPHSDVFELGLVLLDGLAGPTSDESVAAPTVQPGALPELDALVRRLLAADPLARPASRDIVTAIDALRAGEAATARPPVDSTLELRGGRVGPQRDDAVGERLVTHPEYLLQHEIGRGGMGRVLAARDPRLRRTVAVKALLQDGSRSRFMREAVITAMLEHPSIVPIYDTGVSERGEPFYTMRLITGRTLREAIDAAGSLSERLSLLPHAIAVAEAVGYAHSKGIVHRDIKPANVVIGEYGETLVVDWGLAKDLRNRVAEPSPSEVAGGSSSDDEQATAFGAVLGTPAYMAPEQALGRPVDERADVYAVGALLYKLLSGQTPHAAAPALLPDGSTRSAAPSGDPDEVLHTPLDERQPGLPADLIAIVAKATAAAPERRYANAGELADDLKRFTTGRLVLAKRYSSAELVRRWIARHRALVVTVGVAALVLVAGGFLSVRRIVRLADVNSGLLRDSYVEQGRLRLLRGDHLGALDPLARAYAMGATGPATRLLLEEGVRPTRARHLTLRGHTDELWNIAYSPDGRWLASASSDGTAIVWDARTGARHLTIEHGARVRDVVFSPDSRLLVLAGAGPIVRVWDVAAGVERHRLELPGDPRHGGSNGVMFEPGGTRLAAWTQSRSIHLWSVADGAYQGAAQLGGDERILGARFCDDGTCLAAWTPARIAVWDPATLALRSTFVPPQPISVAAMAGSGTRFVVGTVLGQLLVVDGRGAIVARRAAHEDVVDRIDLSAGGTLIATGGNDRVTHVWNTDLEPVSALAGNYTRTLISADGTRVVTTGHDGSVRMWTPRGSLIGTMAGHDDLVIDAAFAPDGRTLATASWDHTVIVWDVAAAEMLRPLPAEQLPIDTQARALGVMLHRPPMVLSDEHLVVGRADGRVAIMAMPAMTQMCVSEAGPPVHWLGWAGAHELVVARAGSSQVELLDLACRRVAALDHPGAVEHVIADGTRILTGTSDTTWVWERDRLVTRFSDYPAAVMELGLYGDQVVAYLGAPAWTAVVDELPAPARPARPRRTFGGASMALSGTAIFDAARGRVVIASLDQYVYVWDAGTTQLLGRHQMNGPIFDLVRRGAAVLSIAGTSPMLWDLATGRTIRTLEGQGSIVRVGGLVGDDLLLTCEGQTATVWDPTTGRALVSIEDTVKVAISATGRTVALIGPHDVRVWSPRMPVPAAETLRLAR